MMTPEQPSTENVPLSDCPTIGCVDCGQPVELKWTGEDEGANIACGCHQIDELPYYCKLEELRDSWQLGVDSQ